MGFLERRNREGKQKYLGPSYNYKKSLAQLVLDETKFCSAADPQIEPWKPCAPPSIGSEALRNCFLSVRPCPDRSKDRIASLKPHSPPSPDPRDTARSAKTPPFSVYRSPKTAAPARNNRSGAIPEQGRREVGAKRGRFDEQNQGGRLERGLGEPLEEAAMRGAPPRGGGDGAK